MFGVLECEMLFTIGWELEGICTMGWEREGVFTKGGIDVGGVGGIWEGVER